MNHLNSKLLFAAILTIGGVVGGDAVARSLPMPSVVGEGTVTIAEEFNSYMKLDLRGEAAEKLFDALEVQAESTFDRVQTLTKTLGWVTCERAFLGDIPGVKPREHTSCDIYLRVKK